MCSYSARMWDTLISGHTIRKMIIKWKDDKNRSIRENNKRDCQSEEFRDRRTVNQERPQALGEPKAALRSCLGDKRKEPLRSVGWHKRNLIPLFYMIYVIYVFCMWQAENTTRWHWLFCGYKLTLWVIARMSKGFLAQETVSVSVFMINNLDKQKSEEQTSWHRALGPWMQAVPHLQWQPP